MDSFEGGDSSAEESTAGRGGIIGARGTADGLVIRIDGRIDEDDLRRAVTEFVSSRERFLSGHDVLIEWIGEKPRQLLEDDICELLKAGYNITVKSSALKRPSTVRRQPVSSPALMEGASRDRTDEKQYEEPEKGTLGASTASYAGAGGTGGYGSAEFEGPHADGIGLFGGMEGLSEAAQGIARRGAVDGNLWDDPDARIIFSTLRSGQRIESEHSLVVFGDINSGAELIAGGDIVVLGTLRGVAHAGAYEESGGGRTIFALNLQPTQLRIGSIISRGTGESRQKGAEIARVDKDFIVVEPYSAKSFLSRKRDQ